MEEESVLLWPLVIAVVAVVATAAWPSVLHYLQSYFLPWVQQVLPPAVSEMLTGLVVFLDERACSVRRTAALAWRQFQSTVLGMETTYRKIGPNSVETVQTCIIDLGDGRGLKRTSTYDLPWQEVPDPVREAMIAENASAARLDSRQVVESRFRTRAKEVGGFDKLVDLA